MWRIVAFPTFLPMRARAYVRVWGTVSVAIIRLCATGTVARPSADGSKKAPRRARLMPYQRGIRRNPIRRNPLFYYTKRHNLCTRVSTVSAEMQGIGLR